MHEPFTCDILHMSDVIPSNEIFPFIEAFLFHQSTDRKSHFSRSASGNTYMVHQERKLLLIFVGALFTIMLIIYLDLVHSHSSESDWMHLCSYWAVQEIWPISPTIRSKVDLYVIFRQTIDNGIAVRFLAALTVLFHPCTGFSFVSFGQMISWIQAHYMQRMGCLYHFFVNIHVCIYISLFYFVVRSRCLYANMYNFLLHSE